MPVGDASPHVELDGVSAGLFIASQNHQHDLLRELTLMDVANRWSVTDTELPRRVADLMAEIFVDYADVRTATREQALAALARGQDSVTLRVPVKAGIVEALHRWLELVETADTLCAQGYLLTLPASAEIRELRRWYVQAIEEQVRTRPAVWPPDVAEG